LSDGKTFANALGELHPDFDLIRGIANSAKHLVLTNPRPHPAAPSHAANTRVQSTGFGQGGYGMRPYGGTPRVMLKIESFPIWRSQHSKCGSGCLNNITGN